MSDLFESKEYSRSRNAYIAFCALEYFVSICVSDAFLATLLSYMNISDSMIGIISSIISLAFLFQLLSILIVRKIKDTKKTVIVLYTLSFSIFMLLYILPFWNVSAGGKTVLTVAFIMLAYLCMYCASPLSFEWSNSYVAPQKRARFGASKELVSLIGGGVFSVAVGYVLDYFTAENNIEGGFLFVVFAVLALNIGSFISLMMIKRNEAADNEETQHRVSFSEIFKNTLGNRNFRSVIVVTALWQMAQYTTVGFMGIFKTKDLLLSVGFVQIINFVGLGTRVVFTKQFGRFSDKKSFASGMRVGAMLAAIGFLTNVFSTPSTWWCVAIFTVLNSVSYAGYMQNSSNIVYSYVDKEYLVQAMAIKNSIGGVAGFLAALGAGKLLDFIQANNNTFFGLNVYGQQVLSFISFMLLAAMTLYLKFVVEKQSIKKQ